MGRVPDAITAAFQAGFATAGPVFRCAHGHTWAMVSGEAKQCPHCGTITFQRLTPNEGAVT